MKAALNALRVSGILALSGAALTISASAQAHGTSKSYADWRIEGAQASVQVNFAAHDVAGAIPGLDANGDRKITPKELGASAKKIKEATLGQVRLQAGETPAQRAACAPETVRLEGLTDAAGTVTEVQLSGRFACASRIGAFRLRGQYLPALEPAHLSVATFSGPSLTAQHVFSKAEPEFSMTLELVPLSTELRAGALEGARASWLLMLVLGLLIARARFVLGLALGLSWALGLGLGLAVTPTLSSALSMALSSAALLVALFAFWRTFSKGAAWPGLGLAALSGVLLGAGSVSALVFSSGSGAASAGMVGGIFLSLLLVYALVGGARVLLGRRASEGSFLKLILTAC